MKLEQSIWYEGIGWEIQRSDLSSYDQSDLVLVFGEPELIIHPDRIDELRQHYPRASIVGGSSAGNIFGKTISDDTITATAVCLEKSQVKVVSAKIDHPSKLYHVSSGLLTELQDSGLRHVLALTDGLCFNGNEFTRAANDLNITVTGGLMGDKDRYRQTYVIANGSAKPDCVVLVGFYGKSIHTGYGCFAGWDEFGVDRVITKSRGNVVYEIDHQPALTLYKKYLGEYAEQLPAAGLRFPLSIRREQGVTPLIRTVAAVNEQEQSLTFAGDVPEGAITVLMKGNIDNLIKSAGFAAEQARLDYDTTRLAIVVSCVGRRLLMDQLADEELERVNDVFGDDIWMTGFYSYGELAPSGGDPKQCELHNQTMTIMTLCED